MLITSALSLKHSNWLRAKEICHVQNEPTSKTEIFDRLVDLFIVSCTIGINDGQKLENVSQDEIHSISHRVISDPSNTNLVEIFDYLTKIIILTCDEPELKDLTSKEKEKLAFDDIKSEEDGKAALDGKINFPKFKQKIYNILCSYANYGLGKIFESYSSHNLELLVNVYSNIEDTLNSYEELPDLEQFGNYNF